MLFFASIPSECVLQLLLLYFWEEKKGTGIYLWNWKLHESALITPQPDQIHGGERDCWLEKWTAWWLFYHTMHIK
jgi:hypothetical protein